jgi:hypothetical protein
MPDIFILHLSGGGGGYNPSLDPASYNALQGPLPYSNVGNAIAL